ncbi:mercuric transport protein MerTP [Flagellimonas pacifica]|uniref:Mercuric transport protein MerT n=1 Tax=Flagellimonas pacifica TaxID=1247520 RepID=A0A285N0Y5_9FLAO|nr:mercuric transport protein MerTP [Allomuricauda parva]SNZ01411.1 copper ion binding protein [Allomuricauda parva]
MKTGKISNTAAYAGILTAIAASVCCITPVLALLAGTSGMASMFAWTEPFRPYLMSFTILVLAFAWYQKLKPKSKDEIDCACEDDKKTTFMQSKKFLLFVTLFAGLMLAFPYYSGIFYTRPSKEVVYVQQDNIIEETFIVEGMTCTGCENHIESEVNKLDGILSVKAHYEKGNTVVKYDKTKVSKEEIENAISNTGYTVKRL